MRIAQISIEVPLLVIALLSAQIACADPPIPSMPVAVTNNAVAKVRAEGGEYLISFNGLGAAKDAGAVHNRVWVWRVGADTWREQTPVPASTPLKGRLASVAVGVGDSAYVFGGYTVARDHSEVSVPDVYRYQVVEDRYQRLSDMPVPVDDSVALAYRERYIYLVSGWHNDGNVNLVQVYDIERDRWRQASPYPGQPVFGHAGAIIGDTLVICDGVAVKVFPDRRRRYRANAACYLGRIDSANPLQIDWRSLPHFSGVARYRMAAAADPVGSRFIFIGGTDNPYNYNGGGYDGTPAEPKPVVSILDKKTLLWRNLAVAEGTMDHRGLLPLGNTWVTLGGMGAGQAVLRTVGRHRLPR